MTKVCPHCGFPNSEDATFCENCGQSLTAIVASNVVCPQCQHVNPVGSRFCEQCGYDLASKIPTVAAISGRNPDHDPSRATLGTPTNNQSQHEITTRHTKYNRWLLLCLVLALIAGGGYLAFKPQATTNHRAMESSAASKESAIKSSSASSSSVKPTAQSRTKRPETKAINEQRVQEDIASTITPLTGTNSVYVASLSGGNPIISHNRAQRAASTIKLFILATAYSQAEKHQLNLNDEYTLRDDDKVGGTGVLQGMDNGTTMSYYQVLLEMITKSDNTAANIMIEALGGLDTINHEIQSLGASDTKLGRKLMDTAKLKEGIDNYTSVRDTGDLLRKMYQHQLISPAADSAMLDILSQNQNRQKLPGELPETATVYNKTGEYGDYGVQNDAAIIANQSGAFVAVVMCQSGQENQQIAGMRTLGNALYHDILGE